MTLLIMAQGKSNNGNTSNNELNTTFHDFLGMSCASDSPMYFASKTAGFGTDVVRLSEASLAGSASSGGGRPPISTTSDLGSVERQVANHIEGVPFYGTRSDLSGPDISSRLLRSKRSNSDSAFMGSSRDGIPQMGPDSFENSHLMKMLRSGSGGERPKRSNDEEMFFSMQPMRPSSSSFMLQPPTGSRTDVNVSKWERSLPMNVGPAGQYPPRAGQFSSFMHQVPPNRFRDANANPSVISQVAAADEGSRTGIKGSGILTSINASSGVSERNPSALMPSISRPMSGSHIPEPESSTTPSRRGLTSASRQMTIFYGGQAHVFDDVHPNKESDPKYEYAADGEILCKRQCVPQSYHQLSVAPYFSINRLIKSDGILAFWKRSQIPSMSMLQIGEILCKRQCAPQPFHQLPLAPYFSINKLIKSYGILAFWKRSQIPRMSMLQIGKIL